MAVCCDARYFFQRWIYLINIGLRGTGNIFICDEIFEIEDRLRAHPVSQCITVEQDFQQASHVELNIADLQGPMKGRVWKAVLGVCQM